MRTQGGAPRPKPLRSALVCWVQIKTLATGSGLFLGAYAPRKSDRPQIELPLEDNSPQPSVIVVGLLDLTRTAARTERARRPARVRIRKEGMFP